MVIVFMLIFFLFVWCAVAAYWKLAAKILRYGGVTWPMAFLVAIMLVGAGGFVRGLLGAIGHTPPLLVGFTVGPALSIALGAWCFYDRATYPDARPLDWPGAFKLSGLAMALNLLFALLLFVVLTMVVGLRQSS